MILVSGLCILLGYMIHPQLLRPPPRPEDVNEAQDNNNGGQDFDDGNDFVYVPDSDESDESDAE